MKRLDVKYESDVEMLTIIGMEGIERDEGMFFTASNGIEFESLSHPEWGKTVNTLFVWGCNDYEDNRRMYVPLEDWQPLAAAIREFNEKHATSDNPKAARAASDGKCRLELIPWTFMTDVADVLAHGADKYGPWNWRKDPIRVTTYVGSMMRHLVAWASGEETDPDSGKSHLVHLIANCLILLDAGANNVLEDDR